MQQVLVAGAMQPAECCVAGHAQVAGLGGRGRAQAHSADVAADGGGCWAAATAARQAAGARAIASTGAEGLCIRGCRLQLMLPGLCVCSKPWTLDPGANPACSLACLSNLSKLIKVAMSNEFSSFGESKGTAGEPVKTGVVESGAGNTQGAVSHKQSTYLNGEKQARLWLKLSDASSALRAAHSGAGCDPARLWLWLCPCTALAQLASANLHRSFRPASLRPKCPCKLPDDLHGSSYELSSLCESQIYSLARSAPHSRSLPAGGP